MNVWVSSLDRGKWAQKGSTVSKEKESIAVPQHSPAVFSVSEMFLTADVKKAEKVRV